MYRNQIKLNDKAPDQNTSFLKSLYLCEDFVDDGFPKVEKKITRLKGGSTADRIALKLEEFLDKVDWGFHTQLLVGMRVPPRLMYCAGYNNDKEGRTLFLFECPYNTHNYSLVSGFFKESYGINLESVEVDEQTKELIKYL
jgi:hypothetical protein